MTSCRQSHPRPPVLRTEAPIRPVTERQREVLAAILSLSMERGYPPSMRDLAGLLGIASTNGVNDHLRALERKRCIARDGKTARGLVLTESGLEHAKQYLREASTEAPKS